LNDPVKAMQDELQRLVVSARAEIGRASDPKDVESLRVSFLGKKGALSQVLHGLGRLPASERPRAGRAANEAKTEIERLLEEAVTRARRAALEAELRGPRRDPTLPGRQSFRGRPHPIARTLADIVRVFERLGFEAVEGPEVETDHYNFESLNFPPEHPARDMQDTFFVEVESPDGPRDALLRTHTSPVQIRTMLARKPPVRVIAPGWVYRCDSDITHSPQFSQVEGLYVDKQVTLGELKGTLDAFAKGLFGPAVKTRFRPSYFPFVEPGAEMDCSCVICGGKGCRVCKGTGWLEILGAGMVHPKVFEAVGYDPEQVTGFAFGMGVERITMLRYGVEDIRLLFENDVRFLSQL
jgi:phenylalanyl-tRNA synthetase alpha chain